jgi:hypothetical protein
MNSSGWIANGKDCANGRCGRGKINESSVTILQKVISIVDATEALWVK